MSAPISAQYLSQVSLPSSRLESPAEARKLLVLDLNGTLIFRTRGKGVLVPASEAFFRYLGHQDTRSWLDTMVWSSAQSHSVADMTDFIPNKDKLLATWARDKFGLKPADYNRKSLTIKDLEIVWAEFTSHNATSTVLVDDSELKAQRQPWNHIVVPEYSSGLRNHDVQVRAGSIPTKDLEPKDEVSIKKPKLKDPDVEAVDQLNPVVDSPSATALNPTILPSVEPTGTYDETLLALIGVLEDLKWQSNAASWIKKGGLLDGHTSQFAIETWYGEAAVHKKWVQKGKDALERFKIDSGPVLIV